MTFGHSTMTEHIGNYTLESTDSSFSLGYKKTTKDQFDLVISGLITFALSIAAFFIFDRLISEFSFIHLLVSIVFAIAIVSKFNHFIGLMFSSGKNIIVVSDEKLIVKPSFFKPKSFSIDDIQRLEYSLQESSRWGLSTYRKNRSHWIQIQAVLKNDKSIHLLIINPESIVDKGAYTTKNELIKVARRLTREIASSAQTTFRYTGTIEE